MSGFMSFLDNIGSDIMNETYVSETTEEEEVVVEKKVKPKAKRKPSAKKDSSVKLIEARIRNKLDDIGLNENAISDVISYVLDDINKVNDVDSKQPSKQAQKQKPKTQVQETVMSRAESLLGDGGDLYESSTPHQQRPQPKLNKQEQVYADVSNRASSLL